MGSKKSLLSTLLVVVLALLSICLLTLTLLTYEKHQKANAAEIITSAQTTTADKKTLQTKTFSKNTIYVLGKEIPYKNGGFAQGQEIIDENPDEVASTYGGTQTWSGTDQKNTVFIGHNVGCFTIFLSVCTGDSVIVTDGEAKPTTYTVQRIAVVSDDFTDESDGKSLRKTLYSTGSGEMVTFQTCISEINNLVFFAYPD